MAYRQGQPGPPQAPPDQGQRDPAGGVPQRWGPPAPRPGRGRAGLMATLGAAGGVAVLLFVVTALAAMNSTSDIPAASAAGPGIGAKLRDGQFEFVVTRVSQAKSVGDTQFWHGDTAQGEFLIVSLRVTNIGSQSQALDGSAQHVYDSAGRQYDASSAADIDLAGVSGQNSTRLDDISPGSTVRGKIAFDMPNGVVGAKIELHESLSSGGVTVRLK